MPHKVSPLSLLSHRFEAFECIAANGGETDGSLALHTEQKLTHDPENPLRWHVELTVRFEPADEEQPSSYRGHVTAAGEFQVRDDFKEKNREALMRVTASSMLYGACRELVANFTARSTHGILSLPSISFRKDAAEENDEDKEK